MNERASTSPDWRTYFDVYGPRLVLYARQWLPAVADAEDAVQEAFIRFWRKHQAPDERHTGLLFAAVRHSALDHLRAEGRRKRRETASAEQTVSAYLPPADEHWFMASAGGEHALEAALRQLAAEQREVLVLKIWGELTFAQIAETLDVSPNTAASRYRYAVNTLRRTLHPACHE